MILKRFIYSLICFTFLLNNIQDAGALDFSINQLPVPGTMLGESAPFSPVTLKGLIVNPQKPLEFQFIVDTGLGSQNAMSIKEEAGQLVKYFLAGLTIPEDDLWVNLSPYEKNRIVPEALGKTDLGRDLLAQDYVLKQLSASLIYPEKDLGKEFWGRVYAKAEKQFGTTNIPVNTFNKVWIIPNQAQVYENVNAAYVTKATLKVMLDEDNLSLQNHSSGIYDGKQHVSSKQLGLLGANIVREIILPEIEKEVNTGKNFAPLRQIFQALILAKWYKETVQNRLLDLAYTNKDKIAGVNVKDPKVKEQIYERYLKAYKQGVFNFIKNDTTPDGNILPRKYFSGGDKFFGYIVARNGRPGDFHGDGPLESLKVTLAAVYALDASKAMLSVKNIVVFTRNKGRIESEDALLPKRIKVVTLEKGGIILQAEGIPYGAGPVRLLFEARSTSLGELTGTRIGLEIVKGEHGDWNIAPNQESQLGKFLGGNKEAKASIDVKKFTLTDLVPYLRTHALIKTIEELLEGSKPDAYYRKPISEIDPNELMIYQGLGTSKCIEGIRKAAAELGVTFKDEVLIPDTVDENSDIRVLFPYIPKVVKEFCINKKFTQVKDLTQHTKSELSEFFTSKTTIRELIYALKISYKLSLRAEPDQVLEAAVESDPVPMRAVVHFSQGKPVAYGAVKKLLNEMVSSADKYLEKDVLFVIVYRGIDKADEDTRNALEQLKAQYPKFRKMIRPQVLEGSENLMIDTAQRREFLDLIRIMKKDINAAMLAEEFRSEIDVAKDQRFADVIREWAGSKKLWQLIPELEPTLRNLGGSGLGSHATAWSHIQMVCDMMQAILIGDQEAFNRGGWIERPEYKIYKEISRNNFQWLHEKAKQMVSKYGLFEYALYGLDHDAGKAIDPGVRHIPLGAPSVEKFIDRIWPDVTGQRRSLHLLHVAGRLRLVKLGSKLLMGLIWILSWS